MLTDVNEKDFIFLSFQIIRKTIYILEHTVVSKLLEMLDELPPVNSKISSKTFVIYTLIYT